MRRLPDEALGDQRLSSVLQGEQERVEPNPGARLVGARCGFLGLDGIGRHCWSLEIGDPVE